jgi:hypothetical protein
MAMRLAGRVDVRDVVLGSSRVVPNAVVVRQLASADMFSDNRCLLYETLTPQLRTLEIFP